MQDALERASSKLIEALSYLCTSNSAHLANHIHQCRLAFLHHLDGFTQRLDEIFGLGDRTSAPATIRARHGAEINVGIFDADADGFVLHRPVALQSNALLVFLIVEIRTIAANDA